MHTSYALIQANRQGLVREPVSLGETLPSRAERNTARSPGSAVFPDQVWNELVTRLCLSHREAEIVRGTFDDQTESAIAADLQIAPSTVHTHVERLHHKLAVTDRAQLLLRIMQEYLALTATPGSCLPRSGARRASDPRLLRPWR
jgi:DNA-binding NarL/FixJ family response regulator